MGERLVESVVTILLAIVGVAMIAVLVSRNANTAQIVGTGGQSFAQSLEAAEAPVLSSGISSLEMPGANAYY